MELVAKVVIAKALCDLGKQAQVHAVSPLGHQQDDHVAHGLSIRRIKSDCRGRAHV